MPFSDTVHQQVSLRLRDRSHGFTPLHPSALQSTQPASSIRSALGSYTYLLVSRPGASTFVEADGHILDFADDLNPALTTEYCGPLEFMAAASLVINTENTSPKSYGAWCDSAKKKWFGQENKWQSTPRPA
eukprot:GFKZ01007186.1.p3 GENE.GFKZ01007186.1~~GFKZ01007186.1.p3  ORF type:complete len:131 (-),score=2.54 GFKZ01007186.1:765-1157(-)